MSQSENNCVNTQAPLSADTRHGVLTIDGQVDYDEKDDHGTIEVVDNHNTAHGWAEPFPADQTAMGQLMRTSREKGMRPFNWHQLREIY